MEFERFAKFDNEPRKKKQKGGNRTCCVPNCNSTDDGTVRYHQFPKAGTKVVIKDPIGKAYICDLRKIWEDRVGVDQKITKHSKVCSQHFSTEDYNTNTNNLENSRLKRTAMPNLNLTYESSAFMTFKERSQTLQAISTKTVLKKSTLVGAPTDQHKIVPCTENEELGANTDQHQVVPCIDLSTQDEEARELSKISEESTSDNFSSDTSDSTKEIESTNSDENVKRQTSITLISQGSTDNEQLTLQDCKNIPEEVLDMFLMHTSFEIENLISDKVAISYM